MTTIVNNFEDNEEDRNNAKAHNEKEIEGFEDTKVKYDQQKEKLEAASNGILNESEKILNQIEVQMKQWKDLEVEQAKLYEEQLEQRKTAMKTIVSEMETVDTLAGDVVHLERELNEHNENKTKLERDQQALQQQLDEIKEKNKENANRQNYLQMSLRTLREEIARIQKESQENQTLLQEEEDTRQALAKKAEELRRTIEKTEETIKKIEREIEISKEEERKLQSEQKNLEKDIEQMKTSIDKLNKMLENKRKELSQLQSQIDAFKETMEQLRDEVMKLQEQINTHNETLVQITQDLNNAEIRLQELDNERKNLEEKQRELEETSQGYDDAGVDKNNQLKRLQQKLTAAEEIYNRSRILVQQLTDKKSEQAVEVEKLKSEEIRLTDAVRTSSTETQAVLDQKNDAVENQKSAEAANQEAQRNLTQFQQQEREHKSQYAKAKNDEERIRIQLQEAELDQNTAENEVIAAQAEVNSAKSMSIVWSLIGMIPMISGFASDKKQELSKAETTLQRANDKVRDKRSKVSDLRDKLQGAQYRTSECQTQHTTIQDTVENQNTIARTATYRLNECKTRVQGLTEQHREATRRQKEFESNLRMTVTKLQRAEAQLSTTSSELERRQEQMTSHATQTENIQVNIEDMNEEITRHDRTVEEHRRKMQTNLDAHRDKVQAHQTQSSIVRNLKDGSKGLKQTIDNMNNNVKAKEREMTHQQALYDGKKMNADELEQDINNRQSTLSTIRGDLERKNIELSNKQREINEKIDQKRTLEEDVVNAKNEKATTDLALREARSRVLAQTNKVKILDQQFNLLNERDKQLCANIKIVEDKMQQKTSEIENNNTKVNDITKRIGDNRTRRTNGERTIDTSNDLLTCLDNQLKESNTRISERELEYKRFTVQLTQANTSFNDNEHLKAECYEKLQELDTNITSFKKNHHEQQMTYNEESKKILEQHPDVVRIRNENAEQIRKSQNKVTTA